jgi:hypothetical protein
VANAPEWGYLESNVQVLHEVSTTEFFEDEPTICGRKDPEVRHENAFSVTIDQRQLLAIGWIQRKPKSVETRQKIKLTIKSPISLSASQQAAIRVVRQPKKLQVQTKPRVTVHFSTLTRTISFKRTQMLLPQFTISS